MCCKQLNLLVLAIFCLYICPTVWANCNVRIRGSMSQPTPVILETNSRNFVEPNQYGEVRVNARGTIQLWCSHGFKHTNDKLLTVTCVGGNKFLTEGVQKQFSEFVCLDWPQFSVQETGKYCENGELLRVGFEIESNRFAEQMQICFNPNIETTNYVYHTLGPSAKFFQTRVERLSFEQFNFFGNKNVERLYTKSSQMRTIASELNLNANTYIDYGNYVYLSRGHLAAKADFVYGAQQRATFAYVNVVPQWQCINGGNWNDLEILIRDLANSMRSTFDCYTGTYGVTTLPNSRGVEKPLYLANNGQIPVPKLIFRIVIDQFTKLGVAIISVNNPHKTYKQIEDEYIICPDVSRQLSYFNLANRTNIYAGYMYACTVSNLLKVVPNLPQLETSGLLA